MAECVYRRQGQSFKSFLDIIANPGDTVTITATDVRGIPDEYLNPFTMNDSGKLTIVVKKKGDYTVSGTESGVTVTVSITERRISTTADVSFINTVTVNANPGATITLSNYSEITRTYSGAADSNGVATVTVKRKGAFSITTSTSSSNTELSDSPVSVDTMTCDTNGAKPTVNHVRVSTPSAYASGAYSVANKQFYTYMERSNDTAATGYRIQFQVGSYPSSLTGGTNVDKDAAFGTSRVLKSGLTKVSFLGNGTLGSVHYFRGAVYVTVGGTKYYGSQKTWSFTFSNTSVYNKVNGASGSYKVPDGCRTLNFAIVGGGGGAAHNGKSSYHGSGGGGGGYMTRGTWSVTPGDVIYFTVGAGGNGGTTIYSATKAYTHTNGNPSTIKVGSLSATANGGGASGNGDSTYASNRYQGGDGGSGGGRACHNPPDGDDSLSGEVGGSNGCAGGKDLTVSNPQTARVPSGNSTWKRSGNGQGYYNSSSEWVGTTYNGVIYCGGGGGGGEHLSSGSAWWGSGKAGGAGGGGAGGSDANGANGTSGSGGGGGGAGFYNETYRNGGSGGSGAVIFSLS